MRLRSTQSGDGLATARDEGVATLGLRKPELTLLPEQAASVTKLQGESGRSFEECAVELGFLPANMLPNFPGAGLNLVASDDASGLDPLIVMISDPTDPVAVATRELRSVLSTMRNRAGDPLRRIVLLSLQAGTEASVLAANLAVTCAISGQRTLLIDANFASPIQHGLFRRSGSKGVCQLLTADVGGHELIQATAVPKLDFLANGSAREYAAELIDRNALALNTELASENYNMVIVDAGEADQAGISCAQGFDGSVLVVQRNETVLSDVRKLVDRLRGSGDTPVGTIVID
jgi:Mrp family chromosome partitioning ATPase